MCYVSLGLDVLTLSVRGQTSGRGVRTFDQGLRPQMRLSAHLFSSLSQCEIFVDR